MIQISQLSLYRGPQQLLNEASVTLHDGWKVGIIGANGVGKSSLFQLLLGQLQPDAGEVNLPGQARIAHMAQEVHATDQRVLDYVLEGEPELNRIQRALADAENRHDHDAMAHLHAELEAVDGYTADTRARQLLSGLGFQPGDAERPVKDLSGGWRIRLNLARALICRSDILLLDEPTNHLDLDATLWLEQWLKQYPGTIILISHDRDFLDNVVEQIIHQHNQQLTLYKGNYSAFERARAQRQAQQQQQFEKQQARIAEIESFVRRFRAKATKAKQAQSRLKELERMETLAPAHINSPFTFQFRPADKVSNPLLQLRHAQCGYPGGYTLEGVNLSLIPGSRIGLLGPNGAGKSTLIKTLVGEINQLAGERNEGEHLSIGYFAQHQLESLDMQASPLLHLQRLDPKVSDQEARNFLGGFGFIGDDALEPVKRFSGGEKARVALALIAWQKPNLLMMDEPTNHLDLDVRHALTMALQNFEGALIIVSHDRHLLRNTVDNFWLVADGQVGEFDGDLEDYQHWLNERNRNQQQADKPERENRSASAADRKEQKRLEAERRTQLRPLKKRAEQLEKQLEKLHSQLAKIEDQLSDADIYSDKNKETLKQLLTEQAEAKRAVEQTEEDWMEALEAFESLEAELNC